MGRTETEQVQARQSFPALPTSPRAARQFLQGVLGSRSDEETHLVASMLTSELVTNAVVHAGTDLDVCVAVAPGELRVEVTDGSVAVPAPLETAPDDTNGRGLHLVDRLASSWGFEPDVAGKTVWFTLPSRSGAG